MMALKLKLNPLTILVTTLAVFLSACQPAPATPTASMPNPASVYCVENGGQLELRQDSAGGVAGICVFPDGSECDEWAYFRGECAPSGGSSTAAPTPPPLVTEPPAAAARRRLAALPQQRNGLPIRVPPWYSYSGG